MKGCYRLTLNRKKCSFWFQPENFSGFKSCAEDNFKLFQEIYLFAKELGVEYIWFFNEPYLEITWYSGKCWADEIYIFALKLCRERGIEDLKFDNQDGNLTTADWFCENEDERVFGGKVHSLCSEFVILYNDYKEAVDSGKGLNKQIERTIHRLCNPLGISYKEEAKICFSRGLICVLFCFFSFKNAVWIYRNIFRQKY